MFKQAGQRTNKISTHIPTALPTHITKNFQRLDNIVFQDKHLQKLVKYNNVDGFQLTKVFRGEAHLPEPTRTGTSKPHCFFYRR